jgi:DNA-binding beta-propeller fold protein YncE
MNPIQPLIRHFFTLLLLTSLLWTCKKESTAPASGAYELTKSALILNEGTFTYGNANIYLYDLGSNQIFVNPFLEVNSQFLGDVLQSAQFQKGAADDGGNLLYLVINNSNRIEIVKDGTFKSVGAIKGLKSPRYMVFSGAKSTKAYVSDLYANGVHIVDTKQQAITGFIRLPGWTEEMALTPEGLWVTSRESNWVYLINTQTDRLQDSIRLGYGPASIGLDKQGMVWVYCAGDGFNKVQPGIYQFNPSNRQVLKSFVFTGNINQRLYPHLKFNPTRDTLYYMDSGIWGLPITATDFTPKPVVNSQGRNFYGFGVNFRDGHLWVCDAKDFLQRGLVEEYTTKSQLLRSFPSGVTPNAVEFFQ